VCGRLQAWRRPRRQSQAVSKASARMFCAFCGVNNTADLPQCFVCGRKLPALDAEAPLKPARPRTLSRERTPAPQPARLGDRLIAVILDSVLLAAFLLFAAAAIWWDRLLVPPLAIAIGAPLLIIFLY